MPRRKKVSKKPVKEKKDLIKSLDGFSLGDYIWCKYFDGRLIEGVITYLSDKDSHGNVVTMVTKDRGIRTAHISMCAHSRDEAKSLKLFTFLQE